MKIEYNICPNSLTGKHKWLEKRGKNANKPDQCILCSNVKADLVIRSEQTQGPK